MTIIISNGMKFLLSLLITLPMAWILGTLTAEIGCMGFPKKKEWLDDLFEKECDNLIGYELNPYDDRNEILGNYELVDDKFPRKKISFVVTQGLKVLYKWRVLGGPGIPRWSKWSKILDLRREMLIAAKSIDPSKAD